MQVDSRIDKNKKIKKNQNTSFFFNLAALLVFFSFLGGLRYLLAPSDSNVVLENVGSVKEEYSADDGEFVRDGEFSKQELKEPVENKFQKDGFVKESVVKEVAIESKSERTGEIDVNLGEIREIPVDWKKAEKVVSKKKTEKVVKNKIIRTKRVKKQVVDHGPSVEDLDDELARLRYLEANKELSLTYKTTDKILSLPRQSSNLEPSGYIPYDKK